MTDFTGSAIDVLPPSGGLAPVPTVLLESPSDSPETVVAASPPAALSQLHATAQIAPGQVCLYCGRRRPRQRRKEEVTDEQYFGGLRRQVRAINRRARVSGEDILGYVGELQATLSEARADEVVGICLTEWNLSWTTIGAQTGMSKEGAFQHWGHLGSARRPGGQPAGLR